jgi:hypothetical protein
MAKWSTYGIWVPHVRRYPPRKLKKRFGPQWRAHLPENGIAYFSLPVDLPIRLGWVALMPAPE